MTFFTYFWLAWLAVGVGIICLLRKVRHPTTGRAIIYCFGIPWAAAGLVGAVLHLIILAIRF